MDGRGANAFAGNFMDAFNTGRNRSDRRKREVREDARFAALEAFKQEQFDFQKGQAQLQNDIANMTRQANTAWLDGRLQGDVGPYGRTPEERTAKYGADLLGYVSPQVMGYQTPTQQNESSFNLWKRQQDYLRQNPKPISRADETKNHMTYVKMVRSDPVVKDFAGIANSYATIQNGYKEGVGGNPAGDMKMIFSYMKMMDPGSTVREGEYATAANVGGPLQPIHKLWNDLLKARETGGNISILSPQQRNNFMESAMNEYDARQKQFLPRYDFYSRLGQRAGYDYDMFLPSPHVEEIELQPIQSNSPQVHYGAGTASGAVISNPQGSAVEQAADAYIAKYGGK